MRRVLPDVPSRGGGAAGHKTTHVYLSGSGSLVGVLMNTQTMIHRFACIVLVDPTR